MELYRPATGDLRIDAWEECRYRAFATHSGENAQAESMVPALYLGHQLSLIRRRGLDTLP